MMDEIKPLRITAIGAGEMSLSFCGGLFTGARGRDYEDQIHAFLLDMPPIIWT